MVTNYLVAQFKHWDAWTCLEALGSDSNWVVCCDFLGATAETLARSGKSLIFTIDQ
jgi:hypothetical protein